MDNILCCCSQALRSLCAAPQPDLAAIEAAKAKLTASRSFLKSLTRSIHNQETIKRDQQLHSIVSKNPRSIFKTIRSVKAGTTRDIQKLTVSTKVYSGPCVPDGFFDSLASLKAPNMDKIL